MTASMRLRHAHPGLPYTTLLDATDRHLKFYETWDNLAAPCPPEFTQRAAESPRRRDEPSPPPPRNSVSPSPGYGMRWPRPTSTRFLAGGYGCSAAEQSAKTCDIRNHDGGTKAAPSTSPAATRITGVSVKRSNQAVGVWVAASTNVSDLPVSFDVLADVTGDPLIGLKPAGGRWRWAAH
jgi:hypothetical protein